MPGRRPYNLPFVSLGACSWAAKRRWTNCGGALEWEGCSRRWSGAARARRVRQDTACDRICAWAPRRIFGALFCARRRSDHLETNLAALAGARFSTLPERQAPQDAAKIEAALRWLEAHPAWLMILDESTTKKPSPPSAIDGAAEGRTCDRDRARSDFPGSLPHLELGVLDAGLRDRLPPGAHAGQARAAPTTRPRREIARELAASRSGWNRPAPISRRQRIGFARYLVLWREKRESFLNGSTRP